MRPPSLRRQVRGQWLRAQGAFSLVTIIAAVSCQVNNISITQQQHPRTTPAVGMQAAESWLAGAAVRAPQASSVALASLCYHPYSRSGAWNFRVILPDAWFPFNCLPYSFLRDILFKRAYAIPQVILEAASKSISVHGAYVTFGPGKSQGRPDSLMFFHDYITQWPLPHSLRITEEKAEMNELRHFSLVSHKNLM